MSKCCIQQNITVPFSYPVYFLHDVFDSDNPLLVDVITSKEKRLHKVIVYIEKNILNVNAKLLEKITTYCETYNDSIELVCKPIPLSGGEELKQLSTIEPICKTFNEFHICRQSFVLIIGGGGLLDAVGFAAAISHRGIRQIRIPTTLLSQDDSGVGVKNGINMFNIKNFAGCFAPPFAVINDFDFLKTLPRRDSIAGISEAFKVAMIKDKTFYEWLIQNRELLASLDQQTIEYTIQRSAELHLEHIRSNNDPFEFGSARPLDFGHWAAHKLEMLTNGKRSHGEAVAIGILIDSLYAFTLGYVSKEEFITLHTTFKEITLPVWDDVLLQQNEDETLSILSGIDDFQEHLGGDLHITMPNCIGNKIELSYISRTTIIKIIHVLAELHKGSGYEIIDRLSSDI